MKVGIPCGGECNPSSADYVHIQCVAGYGYFIKILEYMAYGMPVVLYQLPEGRKSAGGAAFYAKRNDPRDFAEKIAQLLDSKSLR
jgi:glycosyltransferase involved in cell wall biosynthesis